MPKAKEKTPWVMPEKAPALPLQAYKSKPSVALRTRGMIYQTFIGQSMGANIADIGDWEDRPNSAVIRTLLHLGLRVYAKLIQKAVNGEMPIGPGLSPGARVWAASRIIDREVLDQVVDEVVSGVKPSPVIVEGGEGS